MSTSPTRIHSIVGEEISGVCFVRDYVEFHFDGPILRALNNPILDSGELHITFGDPGSRDALCSLIGSEVKSVVARDGDLIQLTMTSGQILIIPLDEASRVGPEGAHFVPDLEGGFEDW